MDGPVTPPVDGYVVTSCSGLSRERPAHQSIRIPLETLNVAPGQKLADGSR